MSQFKIKRREKNTFEVAVRKHKVRVASLSLMQVSGLLEEIPHRHREDTQSPCSGIERATSLLLHTGPVIGFPVATQRLNVEIQTQSGKSGNFRVKSLARAGVTQTRLCWKSSSGPPDTNPQPQPQPPSTQPPCQTACHKSDAAGFISPHPKPSGDPLSRGRPRRSPPLVTASLKQLLCLLR